MIFDIQRNSFVDGPGIRTTVFFKGCNLRCAWCHNPEGQSPLPQIMQGASSSTVCGKEYTVDDVLKIICKDKRFYESTGGGVTFSGGECMLQTDFLAEILKACKENGISTAVDTAGHVPYERFEKILPYTDLFLYDLKCHDSEKHKKYTGVGNELILENLKRLLESSKSLWVRIPIIPTVNDTEKEMQSIKEYVYSCGTPERIELLPYHAMGDHKYPAIGKAAQSFSVPSEEKMKQLKNIFL
ncbi:MAG: glycyl-radical enzyme activating protein [Ruminococcaceae bacterium]|nr:glycyl-radical enzyme activating protein [Oscillospiraceae bacterium]